MGNLTSFSQCLCSSILLLIVMIGCTPVDDTKTTIGVIQPLTGGGAELGQSVQRGIDLANVRLGNKYDVAYEDDQCTNTASALSAAHIFSDIKNAKAVIGPLCTGPFLAVAGMLNEKEIAFISTGSSVPSSLAVQGKYGIAGIATDIADVNDRLAQHVYYERNITKMAVYVWDQEWAIDHRDSFVRAYERLGGEIVYDSTFNIDESQFGTTALKIEKTDAQGVLVVGLNFQNAAIVKQFRQQGVNLPMFGQFEVEDPSFLEATGLYSEGYTYTYPELDLQDVAVQKFINDYKEAYHEDPKYYAFVGYDSLMLYDWAVNQCGSADSACVMETIKSGKRFNGVSGAMSFNQQAVLSKKYSIKSIENGTYRTIG